MMQVASVDFVKSPDFYLDRVQAESVVITKEGREIAVLAKPSNTPVTNSLLGLFKGVNIESIDDIKRMRLEA